MSILPLLLGTFSGICIATGTIFLFTGLRRPGRDRVQILFAFSHAGANLTSILEYQTASLDVFMRLEDWTALFTGLTLIFLMWFVSEYTKARPGIFLLGLTFVLGWYVLLRSLALFLFTKKFLGLLLQRSPGEKRSPNWMPVKDLGSCIFLLPTNYHWFFDLRLP